MSVTISSPYDVSSVIMPPTSKAQGVQTWSLWQMTLSFKVLSYRQATDRFNTKLPNKSNKILFQNPQRIFVNRTRNETAPCRIRARPGVHMKPWQKLRNCLLCSRQVACVQGNGPLNKKKLHLPKESANCLNYHAIANYTWRYLRQNLYIVQRKK